MVMNGLEKHYLAYLETTIFQAIEVLKNMLKRYGNYKYCRII